MKVIKRRGQEQEFSIDKIFRAIRKANNNKELVSDDAKMTDADIDKVVNGYNGIMKKLDGFNSVSVDDIHLFIEKTLYSKGFENVARSYVIGREEKRSKKKYTDIEEEALALLSGNSELRGDNANKNIDDNGAISDYLAGILTKSIGRKMLPKDVAKSHKYGLSHFHDSDYSPLRPMHNCDLWDVSDMLKHTFQMGNVKIVPTETTKFSTFCTLVSQISLIISGRQYGGQTMTWSHLLPYVNQTRNVIKNEVLKDIANLGVTVDDNKLSEIVEEKLREEIYNGVKTYQYQILCHTSANGQTPFVSNNICLREAETQQELEDMAMLIEEIIKRRMKGVQDETGTYISPLFPKLLYWTCDGLNLKEGDPYFYLTELAAECESLRMQPDIMSEKQMRLVKKGQIIPCMGCRSLLAPVWIDKTYSVDEEFYWFSDVERGEYPYGTFVDKKSFKDIPNGEYEVPCEDNYTLENGYGHADYVINFRGNTGWLVKKTDAEVVIRQPKVYGRYNLGVVTVNTPHAALSAVEYTKEHGGDLMENFYRIFDERLEICHKGLKYRGEACRKIKAKNSPILWMYGALARIGANETIGDLIDRTPKEHSISLGYVGLYETCRALIGESNTTENGQKLCKEILTYMNRKCAEWKEKDHFNYSIYGTPEESLTYKFSLALRRDFGLIPYITDKDYVVNSYHVDPREQIDAFEKLRIEGQYLALSSGGAVSYVETNDLIKNTKAIVTLIQYIHEHIMYAEINRKIGVCKKCGYVGDIPLEKTADGDFVFTCPNCGNHDDDSLDVTARLCGYLGKVNAGNTNKGRLDDIYHRVIHTDCVDEIEPETE